MCSGFLSYARSTSAYSHVLPSREKAFGLSRDGLASDSSSRNLTASTAAAHARMHAHAGNTALMAHGRRSAGHRRALGAWLTVARRSGYSSRGRTRATTPETGGVLLPRGWG